MIKLKLIIIACMFANFAVIAQKYNILDSKITLQIENQKIEDVLKLIEERNGIMLSYSGDIINPNRKISLNVEGIPVRELLDKLFPVTNYQYKIINNRIIILKNNNQEITLSGYIKEEGNEEHLIGVSIYVPQLGIGTTSNDYGFFSMVLPVGNHEIFISYLGYSTIQKQISFKTNTILNFEMNVDAEDLDEVIVTANQKIEQSKVTQMSTVRVKPSDIQDMPALLGEKDVLKTLQLLPGIQGGTEGTSGFFVRGGTPDQNLIILDDAPVYNANHLLGFFSVFNGDAIKSVEVFKGGFPARFGGRLSSVLKIDMKDGNKEKFSGKLNIGLISSSLLLEGPIKKGKTSFLFSGRRTYADLLSKPFQDKNYEVVGYHFSDLNLKFHHVFNDKNKLFWSNYFGQDIFTTDFNSTSEESKIKLSWGNITSTLRWNHEFSQKLFSNTSLIFSNYKLKIKDYVTYNLDNSDSRNYNLETSSGINDLSGKIDFYYYPNNKHSIKFGVINTFHSFTPQQLSVRESQRENIDKKETLNSIESALYVEDDWKISNKLSLYPGIRLSYYKYKTTQYLNPEPRLTLSWKVKPDFAIKTSYSEMNQYIHLLFSANIGLPTDLWVSTTEKVKPQTSKQIALGVAKDFLDNGYSLSAEGYYKTLKDVIAYKEGATFSELENTESIKNWDDNITSGKGWAYGTEILFRKQTGLITGWFGYTLSWSQRQFEELNLGRKFNAKYDRRHDISLVGIYKPSKRISISGSWVFSSGSNYTLPNTRSLTTVTNFPINSSSLYNSSDTRISSSPFERNNFKAESTHRLDLGIQFHKNTKRNHQRTWSFSIYNAYGRKNPFIYFTTKPDYGISETVLKKYAVLVFIPSISYTLKF